MILLLIFAFFINFLKFLVLAMSDPLSNPPQETTPLIQDHENQENASAQEPPLPYNPNYNPKEVPSQTEGSPSHKSTTEGRPFPNPPPNYKEIPRSGMNLCYLYNNIKNFIFSSTCSCYNNHF